MSIFTLHWRGNNKTYEISGDGVTILAVYSALKLYPSYQGFHCYREGTEYDLETGLHDKKGK